MVISKAVEVRKMFSTAQESLAELEKLDAPVQEQIYQAAQLAGVPISRLKSNDIAQLTPKKSISYVNTIYHARQEYVLRWLLKKLQDNKTRRCPAAWRLLGILLEKVPVRNVARILSERKFIVTLRQALEEFVGRKNVSSLNANLITEPSDASSETVAHSMIEDEGSKTILRKRKRNGNVVSDVKINHFANETGGGDAELQRAIYKVMDCMINISRHSDSASNVFTSEYMKLSLRASDEEAARILGCWLELCRGREQTFDPAHHASLLNPFIEIWELRIIGADSLEAYCQYCLQPSLELLSSSTESVKWRPLLEKLLVRNVIIPAKTAYGFSSGSDLLRKLIGDVVLSQPLFSSIIFDLAIRCIQPHSNRLRPHHETSWLQEVFIVLKDAMLPNCHTPKSATSARPVQQLLQACIDNTIALELPLLASITSQYGLKSDGADWSILSTIVKLDANLFLIPPYTEVMLNGLFSRISQASLNAAWPTDADKIIDDVLVPLMSEFTKARQLTAFIDHWLEQLIELNGLRRTHDHDFLSAWEDEALSFKLKDLLETSLTTPQIIEILNRLQRRTQSDGAFYVLLDAVTGAISRNESIDAVEPIVYMMLTSHASFDDMQTRYKLRRLRATTHYLGWSLSSDLVNKSKTSAVLSNLLSLDKKGIPAADDTEGVEALRCLCAAWVIKPDMSNNNAVTSSLTKFLQRIVFFIDSSIMAFEFPKVIRKDKWGDRTVSIHRLSGWFICAYAHCLLVEYPEVLGLSISEMVPNGQRMLQNLIWLASTATSSSTTQNSVVGDLADMWIDLLQSEFLQNNPKILSHIISALLECRSHTKNPLNKYNTTEKSEACNGFVVKCLHELPIEAFSKHDREAILKAWPPNSLVIDEPVELPYPYYMNALNPCILSLKMKVMQRPTLYDGINFQDLIYLGEQIVSYNCNAKILLPILEELAKRTLNHVLATIDQPKGGEYIRGMIHAIECWLQSSGEVNSMPSYTMISLVQVAFSVLRSKKIPLETLNILKRKKFKELQNSFRKMLLHNIERRLEKLEKFSINDDKRSMSLLISLNALDVIEVEHNDLLTLQSSSKLAIESLLTSKGKIGRRLELFMLEHDDAVLGKVSIEMLQGDAISFGSITSIDGRQSILQKISILCRKMGEPQKLQLATRILDYGDSGTFELDKLLALQHLIVSCEDSRPVVTENMDIPTITISSVYSKLAERLERAKDVREFCLINETMNLIIETKSRAVTQYNIEVTLATISVLCSRRAPSLPTFRAGIIYLHLISLFRSILNSHRRKLQGRFHIVVQTLKSLLCCLFLPTPSSTSVESSSLDRPSWLASADHHLNSTHAAAFTRLVTLICDPTNSSVSSSQDPSRPTLTSAPKEAKRYAGQYMPYVLGLYLQLQLDLSLQLPGEVRQALTPGLYAILDCTGKKGRRLLGESMDTPGRALLSELIREWSRFGEWKG